MPKLKNSNAIFRHFKPIIVLLKLTCLVTLFNLKLQVSEIAKLAIFGIFNDLLSTKNANVARFARNIEWDFFVIFKHCEKGLIIPWCGLGINLAGDIFSSRYPSLRGYVRKWGVKTFLGLAFWTAWYPTIWNNNNCSFRLKIKNIIWFDKWRSY